MVGDQDLLLRHRHRPVLHLQFVEVKTGGAMLEAQAGCGDKGDIRADMIQLVVPADGGENIVVRFEFAAAQDHFAVRFVLQRQEGIQRVTHRRERQFIGNGIDDRWSGGAAIEKYRVVFADQRSREQADTALLRYLLGFLIGNEIVGHAVTARVGYHIAAEQYHGSRFRAKIAANGHF
ncbi:hypothetical protein D3C79_792330 [compost metagenome]